MLWLQKVLVSCTCIWGASALWRRQQQTGIVVQDHIDMYQHLLSNRIIFLGSRVTDEVGFCTAPHRHHNDKLREDEAQSGVGLGESSCDSPAFPTHLLCLVARITRLWHDRLAAAPLVPCENEGCKHCHSPQIWQ